MTPINHSKLSLWFPFVGDLWVHSQNPLTRSFLAYPTSKNKRGYTHTANLHTSYRTRWLTSWFSCSALPSGSRPSAEWRSRPPVYHLAAAEPADEPQHRSEEDPGRGGGTHVWAPWGSVPMWLPFLGLQSTTQNASGLRPMTRSLLVWIQGGVWAPVLGVAFWANPPENNNNKHLEAGGVQTDLWKLTPNCLGPELARFGQVSLVGTHEFAGVVICLAFGSSLF